MPGGSTGRMAQREATTPGRVDTARDSPPWVTLTDGERIVWIGGPSTYLITGRLTAAAVLAVVGAALAATVPTDVRWIPLLLVPLGVLIAAYAWLRHRSTRYVITTDEVYKKTGLLSRAVINLRMDRIQNTSFSQSLTERVLHFGDVHIDTAGSGTTELVLESVPHPDRVNGIITEQLDAVHEARRTDASSADRR